MTLERKGETVAVLGSYGPSLVTFRGPMIAELARRGHRVVAMAPNIAPATAEALRSVGAEICEVEIANSTLNPLTMLKTLRRLARTFSELAPTAVIPYTIQPVTIGGLAAALARVPKIVPVITGLGYAFGDEPGLRRRISRIGASVLYRLALARSSLVVFQNPDDRNDLVNAGILSRNKPAVIVNGSGVDLDQFRPAPLPEQPSFLMVARLIRDKGVVEYAEAARRLKRKHPQARFRLAGWLDSSPNAISQAELDGMIVDGVEYLGKLSDVRPSLADTSVFVLPSRYREGTPRSSLEAMAMGRPVITCDTPGCRETVVEGENGYLIAPKDADGLTEAMEKFILVPGLAAEMGARSRRLAEQKFDVHAVNEAILEAAGL